MEIMMIIVLVLLVLFLAVVAFAYFSPKGLLTEVGDSINSWADSMIAKIKKSKDSGSVTGINEGSTTSGKLEDNFNNLVSTFKNSITTFKNKENCLIKYNEFPNNFDKENIILSSYEDKTKNEKGTQFTYIDSSGQIQIETVQNVFPCVIAGKYQDGSFNAQRFYNLYINIEGCASCKFYKEATITLFLDTNIKNEPGISFEEKETRLLKNSYYLFKYGNDHLCFLPTKVGNFICDTDQYGFDDNCMDDIINNINLC